jgi:hypothetical protein
MDLEPRKTRRKAKSFKRRTGPEDSGPKELRRRLTYQLPRATRDAMYEHLRNHGLKKRQFVMSALQEYFSTRKFKTLMPRSVTPFEERVFLFDEVPNDMWLRVDEASRDREYNRVVPMYVVVEAAIVLALGLHEKMTIYKTHKEIENERRKRNYGRV